MSDDIGDESSSDLIRSLQAVARIQARWLADLTQVCAGDPRFPDAFRRWEEHLTLLKVHLHRTEARLLHYLMLPEERRGWSGLESQAPDSRDTWRQWYDHIAPYLRSLRLPHHYRRVGDILDPSAEAVTADVLSDLVTVAEVAATTGSDLERLDHIADVYPDLEHLAFYHVIGPWRSHGFAALFDLLRWLRVWLEESSEV